MDPVRHEVDVQAAPERAFAAFGRCYETGPHGFHCDWGRVLDCEPSERLRFTWQISPDRTPQPDPERSSEVEVLFAEHEGGTRVTVVHGSFERHGEEGEGYRDALASERGWPYMLDCLRRSLA